MRVETLHQVTEAPVLHLQETRPLLQQKIAVVQGVVKLLQPADLLHLPAEVPDNTL